jgi:hypothetical protein
MRAKKQAPERLPDDHLPTRKPVCAFRYARRWLSAGVAVMTVAACSDRVQPPPTTLHACAPDARLSTTLHGAIAADIDWGPAVLACEGMPRPDAKGARLRLSAPLSDAENAKTVAFILGIPALRRGETATELPTNVTLIEEGSGRFYGTRDTSGCWTDVTGQAQIDGPRYAIRGTVYCVSPLAELNGGSSISFTELQFSGQLDWSLPE